MKILLASDGSEPADNAARFLRHLPHPEQLDTTVLSCIELPVYAMNETTGDWIVEFQEIAKENTEYVKRKTTEIFQGSTAKLSFAKQEGHPGNEIIEYASRHGFDLIVLGATGHSMLSRILLGSVSDYVATHAPCSVLIVRPRRGAEKANSHLTITLGYDGSPPSQAALNDLTRFGWGTKVEVHLVHAAQSLYGYQEPLQASVSASEHAYRTSALDQLKTVAKQLPFTDPDPKVHLFEASHLGESIVDFATRSDSDVIMLGDKGKSAIDRMLLGSVSRYVLRHAPMSVWIARAPRTR